MTRLISLVTISIAAINAQNAVTQAPLNQRKIIEILDSDDEGGNQSWLQALLSEAEGVSENNLDEFGLDIGSEGLDGRGMRKFRYEFIMAYWILYNGDTSELTTVWADFTSRIKFYGCFCFNEFSPTKAQGKGAAKDLLDQTCKNLYKCQTCIDMDIEQGALLPNMDGQCEYTTTYSFNLTMETGTTTPKIECLNLENTCKRAMCECDKRFGYELAQAWPQWDSRWKGKDKFDRKEECRAMGTAHVGQIDQCCGVYPYRYPYHSNGGQRECCGVKTFEVGGLKKCCDDNVPREVGTCPED